MFLYFHAGVDEMIDTIFIDLDETLVESRVALVTLFENIAKIYLGDKNRGECLRNSFRKSCTDKTYTLPHEEYLNRIGYSWDNIFYSDFSGDDPRLFDLKVASYEYKHSIVKAVLNDYGISDFTLIDSIIRFIFEKWVDYYRPFADAYSFLNECKKYKKYIVTNGFVDIQKRKIQHCGLTHRFEGIYVSGKYGVGKPNVEFFENVLRDTGANKNSTVMIGDNLSTDILGATNTGMKSIYKKAGHVNIDKNAVDATAVIENLTEIPRLLLTI